MISVRGAVTSVTGRISRECSHFPSGSKESVRPRTRQGDRGFLALNSVERMSSPDVQPSTSAAELKSPTIHVIREVYDSGNAHETFEAELEKALEAKVNYIIIEPTVLGDETGRWITVGNCLHKTAVLSGISSIVSGLIWQDRPLFSAPLCAISIFCTGLYTVSWNYDPCCQYQVERDPKKLANVPNLHEFSSPLVLAYSDNTRTKYFHRGITLLSAAFCAWQLYKAYK